MTDGLSELRKMFESVFIYPFASHKWASSRGRSHWVDLEGWQDAMAGPISSITRDGGCDYVYHREVEPFAGIDNPTTLRARLLYWLAQLVSGIEKFVPTTQYEVADLEFMRLVGGKMREVVEQACSLERVRWVST